MEMLERRSVKEFPDCRIAPVEGEPTRMRGYAVVFGVKSKVLPHPRYGPFKEIIHPEAVNRTLLEAGDVKAYVAHRDDQVLAATRSGTLRLTKDTRGLAVDMTVDPEITYARDVLRSVARGDTSGMSFAFQTLEDDWNWDEDEQLYVRDVTDMRIGEVSIVGRPAYQETNIDIAMRSLDSYVAEHGYLSLAYKQRMLKLLAVR